jgi:hypothetical protein
LFLRCIDLNLKGWEIVLKPEPISSCFSTNLDKFRPSNLVFILVQLSTTAFSRNISSLEAFSTRHCSSLRLIQRRLVIILSVNHSHLMLFNLLTSKLSFYNNIEVLRQLSYVNQHHSLIHRNKLSLIFQFINIFFSKVLNTIHSLYKPSNFEFNTLSLLFLFLLVCLADWNLS